MSQFVTVVFSYFMLLGMFLQCVNGKDINNKPNIVILLADDLGYGDLGCYGHPYSTTPNIDALANEGLKFTDFYSSSPACSPSRAALLTGRYQARSGVYPRVFEPSSIKGLPRNETTIAEYVKQAGYSTAIIGKWHLGVGLNGEYLPTHQGFDYYLGIPYSHDQCSYATCFYPNISCCGQCKPPTRQAITLALTHDIDPSYPPCPLYENTTIIEQPANFLTLHDQYVDAATSFIRRESALQNPFFLYFASHHTHYPQYAGEKFTRSSISGRFGDALNELDSAVGSIRTVINEAGINKNTFVFFTSDNGPDLKQEVRGGNSGIMKCGKGTTYEGGQRVPGIAWWPGRISPGKTTEMASTLDFLPTIMKLVSVEPVKGVTLDGYDMGPILFDKKPSLRKVFYYYHQANSKQDGVSAVRYRQYKAHFITQGTNQSSDVYYDLDCRPSHEKTVQDPPLLYDLHLDPSELYTLTPDDPVYNQTMSIILKIKEKLDAEMVWSESQMLQGMDPSLTPCASPECDPFPSCCHTSIATTTMCPL